jgi:hypothetical protein
VENHFKYNFLKQEHCTYYDGLHSLHAYMAQCLLNKHSIKPACDTYGEEDICRRVVVGKHEEKRPLGRPRNRCSVETDLKERTGW